MVEAQKVPHRSEIPVESTWDLTTIYPSDAAWSDAAANLEAMLPEIAALQGTIGQGASALLHVLKRRDDIGQQLWQLYTYAHQRKDSDSTDAAGQGLVERAGSLVARVGAALAFIDPEILALSDETLNAWLREEKSLQIYEHALKELVRQRVHIRSAEVENILAQFGDVTRAPGEIFGALNDADLTFPTIEDEDGQKVSLSHARFNRFRESRDSRVRRDAFEGYYSAYQGVKNTLGATLAAAVRTHRQRAHPGLRIVTGGGAQTQ
jgi:oligoendopeptidase F